MDSFKDIKYLSKGSFGNIFTAIEITSGRKVILKQISKKKIIERKMLKQLRREIEIHAHLTNHPHIINFYGYFDPSQKAKSQLKNIYIVLEFAAKGNLFQVKETYFSSQNSPLRFKSLKKPVFPEKKLKKYFY